MIIEQYVEMIESQLPAIREQERARIWRGVDQSEQAEWQDARHLEDRLDEGVTTRFLLAASVIACWSLYESAVTEMANYIRKRRAISLQMSLLRGDFLSRARTYFADVLGLPLHSQETDWDRLSRLAKLRHFLVHANGDLRNLMPTERSELLRWLGQTNGLSIAADRYLIVAPPFVWGALRFLQELLNELIERVRNYSG